MAGFADNAMRFDGQDDGLVAADDDALDVGVGAGLAVTARIRIRQKNGIYPILEKWAGPGLPGYRVFLDDGQLGVELSDGTTLSTVIAPATMALDLDRQWHFVAVSVHRDAPCAAIDLVVDSQTATFMACGPTGSLTNSEPLWIGHDANGAFSGDVDEVTFFDRPVTPGEIESLRLAHDIDSCKPVPATGTTTATELPREAQ